VIGEALCKMKSDAHLSSSPPSPSSHLSDAPDWDGREAPRLMSKQALEVGVGREPESIRSYAWSDENEKIK